MASFNRYSNNGNYKYLLCSVIYKKKNKVIKPVSVHTICLFENVSGYRGIRTGSRYFWSCLVIFCLMTTPQDLMNWGKYILVSSFPPRGPHTTTIYKLMQLFILSKQCSPPVKTLLYMHTSRC